MADNQFLFFTVNDFSKDGGGTIRMMGIVNALAQKGMDVTLLSNTVEYAYFHHSVRHINIGKRLTKSNKRILQFLLSFLPFFLIKIFFGKEIGYFATLFQNNNIRSKQVIAFEHLDNSLAYILMKTGIVSSFIHDTHGIAPMEFRYKEEKGSVGLFINKIKYLSAKRLEEKVFFAADGFLFVSVAMQRYFENIYDFMESKKIYLVRDGVNSSLCQQSVDKFLVEKYKAQYGIKDSDRVILFAGNFKDLGGVLDLVKAFSILVHEKKVNNIKLLLIGDGERYNDALRLVEQNELDSKVIFAGRRPYAELKNHQELADVIVCPDKKHPFSELVPHIKYFDSLASGKVVINGSFASVKEINPDERFSVDFEPSNVADLANKIEMVLKDIDTFKIKYKDNPKIICTEYTYDQFVKVLVDERRQ